jgi:hypothetical protein
MGSASTARAVAITTLYWPLYPCEFRPPYLHPAKISEIAAAWERVVDARRPNGLVPRRSFH